MLGFILTVCFVKDYLPPSGKGEFLPTAVYMQGKQLGAIRFIYLHLDQIPACHTDRVVSLCTDILSLDIT